MSLVKGSGCEEQRCLGTGTRAVAKSQAPYAVDSKLHVRYAVKQPNETTARSIGHDYAASKHSDKDVPTKSSEALGRNYHGPRRIVVENMSQPEDQVAGGVIDSDVAVADARHIVLFVSVLFRIRYCQLAITYVGDVERRESGRNGVVRKRTCTERERSKVLVEHINRASVEVGYIQIVVAIGRTQGDSFLYGATIVVHGNGSAGTRTPARDGSILRGKDEDRRAAVNLEITRWVEHLPGRRALAAPAAGWNRNFQGPRFPRAVVNGGKASTVIGNPPGAGRAVRDAPRVDQVAVLKSSG